MSLYSDSVEVMFDQLFKSLGFESPKFSVTQLHKIAEKARPGRVENVVEKIGWNKLNSPKRFLDYVYGLDSLYIVDGKNTVFGFDWTVNDLELDYKVDKLKSFSTMWQALGVSRVSVVHFVVPLDLKFEGWISLKAKQFINLEDQLLEIIAEMAEEKETLVTIKKIILNPP